MSALDDGGPAFPVAEDHKVAADIPWTCGMSLRDYFAAKAMQSSYLLAQSNEHVACEVIAKSEKSGKSFNRTIADAAYLMADAMLEARK